MFFKDQKDGSQELPLLPLRDLVVFPHMVVPLIVGQEKSIATLQAAQAAGKLLLLASQHEARTADPNPEDIREMGCIAKIVQMLKLPDGTLKVLVEGRQRGRIQGYVQTEGHFSVDVERIPVGDPPAEAAALMRQVRETFEAFTRLDKSIPPEMRLTVRVAG